MLDRALAAPHDLNDLTPRQAIERLAALYDQDLLLAQARRDRQDDLGAFALLAGQGDRAAQLLDDAAHDVEADAAARQIGHLRAGREAVLEEEVEHLRLAERGRRLRRQHAAR